MIFLAHRGYWLEKREHNSQEAFERALHYGFGIETDVRDYKGQLVISHDIAEDHMMSFEDFLKIQQGSDIPLAINIKADGLSLPIKELLIKYSVTNYFCFDLSIPEHFKYLKNGIKVYSHCSDISYEAYLLDGSQGVWLDSFKDDWYDEEVILRFLNLGKKVAIVSPELHGRPYENVWKKIKSYSKVNKKNILLCTDYPTVAQKFFNEVECD